MDALDVARWQFGIVTIYHFLLVPLTIGLAPIVAIMQTAWHRTGKESWLRLTHFFGKLLLINFALGVATGIVQEFQFGMNWSDYSRFVGDVFGAPLAMEGSLRSSSSRRSSVCGSSAGTGSRVGFTSRRSGCSRSASTSRPSSSWRATHSCSTQWASSSTRRRTASCLAKTYARWSGCSRRTRTSSIRPSGRTCVSPDRKRPEMRCARH